MGCDVHMFVEKRNPSNNRWEKLGSVFLDRELINHISGILSNHFGLTDKESHTITKNFFKGVKPTNKYQDFIYKHIEKSVSNDPHAEWWKDDSIFPSPYKEQPYSGRNYGLFGALAGVRNYHIDMISGEIKGLPDDVSNDVCEISNRWDGHSHNYLTVKEIMDSTYYKMSDEELDDIGLGTSFFRDVVDSLLEIGDSEDVRIVFWFDS